MGNKPVKMHQGAMHSAAQNGQGGAPGTRDHDMDSDVDMPEESGPLPTAALIHPLLERKLTQLDVTTVFTQQEINAIHRHIAAMLEQLEDDPIRFSRDEFFTFLGTSPTSLYANRLYAIFDVAGKGTVDFQDLIRGLALLSQKSPRDLKLLLSFHLLDSAGTGFITKQATTEMLRSVLAECKDLDIILSPEQINKIVESTFDEADLDHNNVIDLKEYQTLDKKHPGLFDMLTVDAFGVINHLEKIRSMATASE